MIGCPSRSPSCGAMTRATVSLAPPGGWGMRTRIGRDGGAAQNDVALQALGELEVRCGGCVLPAEHHPEHFGSGETEERDADDQWKELRLPRPAERAEDAPGRERHDGEREGERGAAARHGAVVPARPGSRDRKSRRSRSRAARAPPAG